MSFDDHEYLFKAGIKQSGPNKYKPFLEYKVPEGPKSRFSVAKEKLGQQQLVSVEGI